MTKGQLQRAADMATIAVAMSVLAVMATRFLPLEPEPRLDEIRLDGAALGVEWSDPTLIMVLRSDCGYCQESMPFYRRLTAEAEIPVIVAARIGDDGIRDYLAEQGVQPDELVMTVGWETPATGTPTIFLVDGDGVVMSAWVGWLSPESEEEVLAAVRGPVAPA